MELTIDEVTTLVFQHSRLAMQARKLADEHDRLAQVYLEVGNRFHRENEEKASKMKLRKIMSGVLSLLVLFVLMGSLSVTRAQDVAEATAAVTASVNGNPVEATLEPGNQPTEPPIQASDRTIYVIGFIVLAIFGGAINFAQDRKASKLIDVLNAALTNKQVLDESRESYMQSSLKTQEYVKLLQGFAGFLASMNIPVIDPALDKAKEALDYVTEGKEPTTSQVTATQPNATNLFINQP